MGAHDARTSRHLRYLSSRVEPGVSGIPDWEAPRARRSTLPEVATVSENRRGRRRGSVLPNKESRRSDDGEPDI